LDDRIADYALKNYEMPVSQMQGIHNSLADLSNAVPLDTVRLYADYIARLRLIPRAFEQAIEVPRQGQKDGLMPVRLLLEQIPAQCEGAIAENPFLAPTKKVSGCNFDSRPTPAYRRNRAGCECGSIAGLPVLRGVYCEGLRSAWSQHNRAEQFAGRASPISTSDPRANHHRNVSGGGSCARASRGRQDQWVP
jgi:hypothetical protein